MTIRRGERLVVRKIAVMRNDGAYILLTWVIWILRTNVSC